MISCNFYATDVMQGFVKVIDEAVYKEMLNGGFVPFSESGGVYTYAQSEKLLKLLNEKFGKEQFFLSGKLTF